jgi:hypothetical protein
MTETIEDLKKQLAELQEAYIDKKRVMQLWSCSGQTVERAAKEGKITKYYLEGQRVVRYKLIEVMRALKPKITKYIDEHGNEKTRIVARGNRVITE